MARLKGSWQTSTIAINPSIWPTRMEPLDPDVFDDDGYEYYRSILKIPEEDEIAGWVKWVLDDNKIRYRTVQADTGIDASRISRWMTGKVSIKYEDVCELVRFANGFLEIDYRRDELPDEETIVDTLRELFALRFRSAHARYVAWRIGGTPEIYREWYDGLRYGRLTYGKIYKYLEVVLDDYRHFKESFDAGMMEDWQISL